MKTQIVEIDGAAELDSFVASHRNGHFLQTSRWGRVKDDWKWFGALCRNDAGEITGSLATLVRKISKTPFSMMYAPRGPVCDFDDAETFAALLEAAKLEGKKYNAYELKIDKDVPVENKKYEATALSNGFRLKKRSLDFEDFQCRFVFRLNLDGKTQDEIFSSFHSKHRYNIRLAIKKGVKIEIGSSEKAEEFAEMMKITGERDNFPVRSAGYFAKILDAFGEDARLYTASYEGEPIAGSLAVRYGDKVWYFYGASLDSHRNVMPNYLLQWEMIKWAMEKGCRLYDFRGVSGNIDENNPLYGLYRFKKGFGGEFIEFLGEMDLTIKPAAAKIISASQKIIKRIK